MGNPRMLRVAELIQSELAHLVMREVKDPRVRHVVITRVEVSPDLRAARVFFSRYGEGQGTSREREEGGRGLERACGFLQRKLGERLQLKRTPRLRFLPDLGLAHSDEIERLLAGVRKQDGERMRRWDSQGY